MTLTPAMIETMAAAAHEANRPPRYPTWSDPDLPARWKEALRREVTAAIKAGVAAGFLTVGAGE